MKNFMRNAILLVFVAALFVRCTSDKDGFFDRPSWLEPPIYEVLQKQGRFTNYLKCVDRTLYASALKSSGLYTVLAPNDAAFTQYLSNKGYSSVDAIPDSVANKIVSYSMVYNNYKFDHLTDVLSGGWDTLTSIKKKTACYETIHQENYKSNPIWVFDMSAFSSDMNYKYVPFYLSKVFEKNRSASAAANNYNTFYTSAYTGSNVQNASILEKDMIAENGVVHEVDQVLEPLPTLEKLLDDPNFSKFKSVLTSKGTTGEPNFITYTYNQAVTDYFKEAMPKKGISSVYLKYYTGLPYNINGELYGTSAKQAEQGGFTLFAPNNEAMTKFEQTLKDYYPGGVSTMPKTVLNYFLNAQMVNDMIWPDNYKSSLNSAGEYFNGVGPKGADFDKSNFSKLAPASNGLFYGSSNYVRSSYFETVYTEPLLNSSYSLFNTALTTYFSTTLQLQLMHCPLNGYSQEDYTILMPSDQLLANDGFSWTWQTNQFAFAHSKSGSTLGNFDVATRMQRLVQSHIFKRIKTSDLNYALAQFNVPFGSAAEYGGYSYAVNAYGDMIRFKDNKVQMLGNYDENDWVTVTPYKTFSNGQVFTIDKLLQYSPRNTYPNAAAGYKTKDLVTYVDNMFTTKVNPGSNEFIGFLDYFLTNLLISVNADQKLTILVPNNTAMAQARANGDLPAYTTGTTFNTQTSIGTMFNALSATDRNKIVNFVLYHLVKNKEYVDDGLQYILPNDGAVSEEIATTMYKDVADNTNLSIRKGSNGKLVISTTAQSTGKKLSASSREANVVRGLTHSNFFGANAVIHEIDNYVAYKRVQ